MASSKKIVLESSDGELFEVHEAVALEFETIRPLVEKDCDDNCIRIPNVSSKILAMAIEYSEKHVDAKVSEDDLNAWDREFVNLDQATLFDLLLAANYLELKSLLDLISMTIANMMKGKTPEEIRRTFDVKDDFTPEEMGF